MRTLVISDIHFGAGDRVDLLRRPELREPLLAALADVDRLVLLGDLLELRHGPRRDAVNAARPFFEDLGRGFADREVIVLAGNHDHALVEPWLSARTEHAPAGALAPEQRFGATDCSPAIATLAQWAAPARVSAAYPGLWLREDVYATHGHYLDCHLTVPTLERLGFAAMGRIMGRPIADIACADDYEAVMRPVFAWLDAIAEPAPTGDAFNGQVTIKAWHALRPSRAGRRQDAGSPGAGSPGAGAMSRSRSASGRLLTLSARAGFAAAVAALNRAGLGPLRADISRTSLRRSGLRAMGEVAQRLGLGDAYVIFGHTHRAGPLPGDDPAEWNADGVRLLNCGTWSYDGWWIGDGPQHNPYWPGGCVLVEDEGPPRFMRLLDDRGLEEIRPPAAA